MNKQDEINKIVSLVDQTTRDTTIEEIMRSINFSEYKHLTKKEIHCMIEKEISCRWIQYHNYYY